MKACLILVLVGVAMIGPRVDAISCLVSGPPKTPAFFEGHEGTAAEVTLVDCNAQIDNADAATNGAETCKVTHTAADKKYKWECGPKIDDVPPGVDHAKADCTRKNGYKDEPKGTWVCITSNNVATDQSKLRPAPELTDFTPVPVVEPEPEPFVPTTGPAAEGSGNSFKPGYLPFVVAAVVVLGKSFVAV